LHRFTDLDDLLRDALEFLAMQRRFGRAVLARGEGLQGVTPAIDLLQLAVVLALQRLHLLLLPAFALGVLPLLAPLDDRLYAGDARQEAEQSLGLPGEAGADDAGVLCVVQLLEGAALRQMVGQ